MKIDQGIILAAGFGKRLRPHTADRPKPLVKVAGTPILESVLTQMERAGVSTIAVNTHYKADQIKKYLAGRRGAQTVISHEPDILNTGGGIKQAAGRLDMTRPFYVLSGDSLLVPETGQTPLQDMAQLWDPDEMDIIILLQPLTTMTLTTGRGDYDLDNNGRALRAVDKSGAYMWTSVRICHPRIFEKTPDGPFSFLDLLDRAEQAGRLYGCVHKGQWLHISTPEDLARVNTYYEKAGKAL